ncbi:MAG: hypothetical protein KIT09_17835 [Bryobacteraceae bacterium]|nr:hypothetical protein [Bryobacteraceae bacterium]
MAGIAFALALALPAQASTLLQARMEIQGHNVGGDYLIGLENGRAFALFDFAGNDWGGCVFGADVLTPGARVTGSGCQFHTIYDGDAMLIRNRLDPEAYLYGGMYFEFGTLQFPDFPTTEFGLTTPVRYELQLAAYRGMFYIAPDQLFDFNVRGRGQATLWFTGVPYGDGGWAFDLERAELRLDHSSPEPATVSLVGGGAILLGLRAWKRRRPPGAHG